jgi:inorganic pyrophosphatase
MKTSMKSPKVRIRNIFQIFGLLASLFIIFLSSCRPEVSIQPGIAPGLTLLDERTIAGPKNFKMDYPIHNSQGLVNLIIEIPTGSNALWKVVPDGTRLTRGINNGQFDTINYIGCVGNYGSIPSTKVGDGNMLNMLALGPTQPLGAVVGSRLIGVMRFRERNPNAGNEIDILLGIVPESPLFRDVYSLDDLDKKYTGISEIASAWLSNYQGEGIMLLRGFGEKAEAQSILDKSVKAYSQ